MPNRSYNPRVHHRRSIRLPGYAYAGGLYLVTICAHGRACLFGEVVDGVVVLSTAGQIVAEEWMRTEALRPEVVLDAFVVMPNHLHGILGLTEGAENDRRGVLQYAPTPVAPGRAFESPSQTLGAILRGFKGATTRRINRLRGTPGAPVWQRNYWERVLRAGREREIARRYVLDNPLRWAFDRYHPERP